MSATGETAISENDESRTAQEMLLETLGAYAEKLQRTGGETFKASELNDTPSGDMCSSPDCWPRSMRARPSASALPRDRSASS